MLWLPTVEGGAFDLSCLRLHRFAQGKTIRLLVLLAALLPVAVPAAVTNYVWDGGAGPGLGNARWNRAGNWTTNIAPPANNLGGLTNTDVTFRGLFRTAPRMENDYYVRSLVFDPLAGIFVLSSQGSEVLTIGAGGILNQSANTQTILSSLSLSNSQVWNAEFGDLLLEGMVNLGTHALTVAGVQDVTLGNEVYGAGQIIKVGTGNLLFAGTTPNTYSGGTTLNEGTITVTKVNALGSGPLTVNSGTLDLGSFDQYVGVFTISGGSVIGTTATLTATAYNLRGGTLAVSLGGNGPFVQSGPGTTTLTSANVFSGGTTINGGTLLVNNPTGSGTGSGNVVINSGGTLRGGGSISGMVTNGPGGTLSAGNNVGQFNTGTQFWLGGSTNRFEISDATGTPGVGWDLLNISGALNILATSSNKAVLDVVSFTLGGVPGEASNFDPEQTYLWKIAQTSGGILVANGEDVATVFELMTGGFANPFNGQFDLSAANGGLELNLSYTPMVVPEPDRLSMMGLGVCAYIYGRRFKRNWRSERRPVVPPPAQPSNTATAAA